MRVLVCGGRKFSDKTVLFEFLDGFEIESIVSGCAKGADMLAIEWAKSKGLPLHLFPADWNKHGRRAGPIRNAQMLEIARPDMVVAFEGGKGTRDMIKKAKRAGVIVLTPGWEP